MEFNKNELAKSPLNYTGGKFKLLPQLLPLFPEDIDTFYDLFAGGCNVGVNVGANRIICNDIETHVIDLMKEVQKNGVTNSLNILKNTIEKYKLSKTNEEGFKRLRDDYNNGNKSWDMFYALVTNAFNNQIRFSKQGNYNIPFGRRDFNPNLEKNFIKFFNKVNEKNIEFISSSFLDLEIEDLNSEDFVYCDPPYLITCATYNEQGGWNINLEKSLLNNLDRINNRGVRFALSNVLENKGRSNDILKEWAKKYKIHYLNNSYGSCSYHAKDKAKNNTVEVLITNY